MSPPMSWGQVIFLAVVQDAGASFTAVSQLGTKVVAAT